MRVDYTNTVTLSDPVIVWKELREEKKKPPFVFH